MCILSVSLEIPSSLSPSSSPSSLPLPSPSSSFPSRHRRSLSDTFIFNKLNKFNSSSLPCISFISPRAQVNQVNIISSPSPSTSPSQSSSIPLPPPLPESPTLLIKTTKHSTSIKESISKYNVYDNGDDNEINRLVAVTLSSSSSSSSIPSSSSSSSSSSPETSISSTSTSSSLYSSNGASSSSTPSSPSPPPTQCPVCFEDTAPLDFLYFLPCLHPYCKDCVKEHLKALVSMGQKLSCMSPNCKSIMPPVVAKPLMDKSTYKRYKLLQKTPAGAHRWCPRAGCDTPYIKEDVPAFTTKVICKNTTCNLEFCYECRVIWHEGLTCIDFKENGKKERKQEEILSEEYAKENLKECPNCSIWVEKIDGCEYVMCTACRHEFCWNCLEPHDHNMSTHKHGPRYKPTPRKKVSKAKRVGKVIGIGIACTVLGPPAVVLGAAAAVFVLPALGIHHLVKRNKDKKRRKKYALNY